MTTPGHAERIRANALKERHQHDARMEEIDFDLSPFTVAWEVTRACALICMHCRAVAHPKRDPTELTFAESIQLIDDIKSFGNPILIFTGGDPLMRRDLFDLIAYASHEKKLRTSLTPSATALASRSRLLKAKESGILRVAVSLDGPTAEVHDAFRGFQGSYDRTIDILQILNEIDMPLQINTTICRYNLPVIKQMPDIVERFRSVQWSVFFLVATGRGKVEDMISPEEHEWMLNYLYDLGKTAGFDIKATACPHYRRVAIQRQKAKHASPTEETGIRFAGAGFRYEDGLDRPMKGVNDGKGFVFISHKGDVCPSGFLPVTGGNVREKSIVEIYRNAEIFRQLRAPSLLKGKCGVCDFREVCGGSRARSYAITGDYLAEDPYCVYVPGES